MDIVTHLKAFLIIISALFFLMHVGAALAFARDVYDARVVVKRIKDPSCGFEPMGEGSAEGGAGGAVWTWLLYQDKLEGDAFCVQGPIVNACGVIGLPFSRLRASIPEASTAHFASPAQLSSRHAHANSAHINFASSARRRFSLAKPPRWWGAAAASRPTGCRTS